jgi:hypothetical protein
VIEGDVNCSSTSNALLNKSRISVISLVQGLVVGAEDSYPEDNIVPRIPSGQYVKLEPG